MNKKGFIKITIIIILIVLALSYFGYKISITRKQICEEEHTKYGLKFCKNNLAGIEMCDRVNMELVRTEVNFFSSDNYVCINEQGEIYKI